MRTLYCYLLFFSITSPASPRIQMAHYPAPSPDAGQIAFCYQGDLWTVPVDGGTAQRLTVHEAIESYPVWSPDGKEIAFSSDRFGNTDIYIMPLVGGGPERMTYFSTDDRMCDWSPDGRTLFFTSRRDFFYHRMPVMYQIDRTLGGTPRKLLPAFVNHGKMSPNNKYLVFARGRNAWNRKHYRGSSASDIWLYDFEQDVFTKLTEHNGHDWSPLWDTEGKRIYYVTDKGNDTFNLWQMDLDGGEKKQLTFHRDDGVRNPGISYNGRVISYERAADIMVYYPGSFENKIIHINTPADIKANAVEDKTFSGSATEMAVSGDEKKIAFVVRGDIYITEIKDEKGGITTRLTHTSARERNLCWAPRGDTLVYTSDRNGQKDIFMLTRVDTSKKMIWNLSFQEQILFDTEKNEREPKFSPDGKKLAFIRGNGDLIVADVSGKKQKTLMTGWAAPQFVWSPDSKWLAYSREDNEFNSDVFIVPAQGGEPVNISRHPDEDISPFWSQHGKKLIWAARRNGDTFDLWGVYLQKVDARKTEQDWAREEQEPVEDAKKNKKPVQVKIDFPNIYKRQKRLTTLPGSEANPVLSPDGTFMYFSAAAGGKRELFKIRRNGEDIQRLTTNGSAPKFIQISKNGKTLYFLSKGKIHSISNEGKNAKNLPFKAKKRIDYRAERAQKFDEAWKTLHNRFYDPDFHGVDWEKMKKKYRPWALNAVTTWDFNYVMSLMLGELNASHLGISGPSGGPNVVTGLLGVRFDESWTGKGQRVKSVLPDSPCDYPDSRIRAGEIIREIDDGPVSERTNIYRLLNNKVGEHVKIKVEDKNGNHRVVVVKPIRYGRFLDLEYDRWVEEKRTRVERMSDGRLAYLHIRGMGMPNVEKFELELYAKAHGKDAMIIDVRQNGGGWVTDYLLAILAVKPHAWTVPRDGGKGYPQGRLPLYHWSKPVVVMCDEWSFSNAEIFAHAIKALDRGQVVGAPTGGLVISTGSVELIDGAHFRVPFRGWFALSSGLNMENNGCIPHHVVWARPGDAAKGTDRQLEKAVQVLLEDLAE